LRAAETSEASLGLLRWWGDTEVVVAAAKLKQTYGLDDAREANKGKRKKKCQGG